MSKILNLDHSRDNHLMKIKIETEKETKKIQYLKIVSLLSINQVPHLFIHLMAYAELDTKVSDEDKKIK